MFTIPATGPVDDLGRLVPEDDAAAQPALSVTRPEVTLERAGRSLAGPTGLRVLTTDRTARDQVYDVLTDRLTAVGADPYLSGLNDVKPTPKEER